MEPPYAERHVRWCERSHGELIPMLLLDCAVSGGHICKRDRTNLQFRQDKFTILAGQIYKRGQIVKK